MKWWLWNFFAQEHSGVLISQDNQTPGTIGRPGKLDNGLEQYVIATHNHLVTMPGQRPARDRQIRRARHHKGTGQGGLGAARCRVTGSPPAQERKGKPGRWVEERALEEGVAGPALSTIAKVAWVRLHPIPQAWGLKHRQVLTGKPLRRR
jgi:hypothetical protein